MVKNIILLPSNNNRNLAQSVAEKLRLNLGALIIDSFADGEINVQIHEDVCGKDVIIISPTSRPVNDSIMEICLLADASRRSGAKSITAIIPYFGYARKERQSNYGEPISAKVVIDMLVTSGVNRIMSCDLHTKAIAGFSTIPFEEISTLPLFAENFHHNSHDTIIFAPDSGGVKRARDLAKILRLPVGFIEKNRDTTTKDAVDIMSINGVVADKNVIIVDDIISTGGTLINGANFLKMQGAKKITVYATHAVFSNDAITKLNQSCIDKIIISDTIATNIKELPAKFKVITVSGIIAQKIKTGIC